MTDLNICQEEEFLKQVIPNGWRVIKARERDSFQYFILNPDGKRFETFDDVLEFLVEENQLKKRGLRRKLREVPPYLTTSIILRRQQMKMKSPFSNLLKKTLEKVHVMNDVLGKNGKEKLESIIAHKELSKRKKKIIKLREKKMLIVKAKEKRRYRGF